jgi:ATP-binding cassette subfamily B multidrug efflux pump
MSENKFNDTTSSNRPKGFMGRGSGHGPMGMGAPVEKAKNFKGTLRRLVDYLKPEKTKFIIVLLMSVLSTVFAIISPKIMGKATTEIFKGLIGKMQGIENAAINFEAIKNILITLIVLYIFSAIFQYLMQYMMVGVAQRTVFDMRKKANEKLARLPLKYFDSKTYGEILSRVTNDIDNISTTLQQSLTQLITSIITILGILIMMLTISPLLTLIAIVTLPLSVIITKKIASKSQKQFAAQQKKLGQMNGHVEEMYTGHKILKSFGKEKDSIEKFETINEDLYEAGWKAQFISGLIMPLMQFISNIGYVFICVVGGILVTKRAIEIGDIQAFIQYSRQFTHPIVQMAQIANVLQSTIASSERVFELLDEDEELADINKPKTIDAPKGNVIFDNVEFGYSEDKILMKNLNINVKEGQTVAIVGPTGAGKTTLVNLLMRFYEVSKGKISIDSININDIKRGSLRNIFGMVLQDTWLFNGTIKDNIGYGKEDATISEIIEVAKAAHAHHFIKTLPDGYETVLNEEASNISQGQKQLLTIARAILANPSILILDEATSSVDTRTEILIQNAMLELMKGRTNFVIAHRLSTIRDADLILVMDEGDIIEKGTHNDLLSANGFYAELYNSQFTGAAT